MNWCICGWHSMETSLVPQNADRRRSRCSRQVHPYCLDRCCVTLHASQLATAWSEFHVKQSNWQVEANAAKLVFPRGDTTKSEFLQMTDCTEHIYFGAPWSMWLISKKTVSYSIICSTIQSREKSCKKLRSDQRRCSNGWKKCMALMAFDLMHRLIWVRDSRDFILRCR